MKRTIELVANGRALPFLVEDCAFEGVKRIAQKVALDVEKVSGIKPRLISQKDGMLDKQLVLCATLGKSTLAELLSKEGKLDCREITGKREVYGIFIVEQPFDGVDSALVIVGSDKLGTIYGMFALSEHIGVSPMCYFGDAEPLHQDTLVLSDTIEKISREPSVKYRGFFINDEWPCFGNWTFSHFGGFTADMYDHVFEFLLRMKGNYMWPAMWTSSFPLDGPGSRNEELADMYGITIGYSHHEPCLRASEEWDKVRGEDSPYGNQWNYYTNSEGLSKYWADALKRSGKYKHLITIGMRGERDSSMLGPDATLKDNIDLLKDIITRQRQLIKEYVNQDVDSVPQLLALYKEVEAYFYGDENTEGLKEWKELDNVIFMLCEDNFGHMRTLPTKEMRSHKGGFGMYYHFDYHGGPVSYEWMPSSPLALTWEQMTQAYDYGIRDVWIVNVGDLKGNEVALNYFLTLAYDFDTWGSSAPNSWKQYLVNWVEQTFPGANPSLREKMAQVYIDFVNMNATRRPEALHAGVYHPCHFQETDRMLAMADRIEQMNEEVYAALDGVTRQAYYSMIYYPAKISVNLVRMHLYAGKNAFYANQGRKIANKYGELMSECIKEDRRLSEEFGAFRDGKWKGMELEKHVGFTSWNDDGWKYPVRMYVEPVTEARMSVSRADEPMLYVKVYGPPRCIRIHDFLSEGVCEAALEISNDGVGTLQYEITPQDGALPEWLTLSSMKGQVEELCRIDITCDREKLTGNEETVKLLISDGDTRVAVEIKAKRQSTEGLSDMTFLDTSGVITMEANHYAGKEDVADGAFELLKDYGRSGNGMKVFPSTLDFTREDTKPRLTYSFVIPKEGDYRVELWTTPTNSLKSRRPLQVEVTTGDGQCKVLEILSANYRGGENSDGQWCQGVMEQIRKTATELHFTEGIQNLSIGAMEAGMVLERILIYPKDMRLKDSYLGPKESFYVKKQKNQ